MFKPVALSNPRVRFSADEVRCQYRGCDRTFTADKLNVRKREAQHNDRRLYGSITGSRTRSHFRAALGNCDVEVVTRDVRRNGGRDERGRRRESGCAGRWRRPGHVGGHTKVRDVASGLTVGRSDVLSQWLKCVSVRRSVWRGALGSFDVEVVPRDARRNGGGDGCVLQPEGQNFPLPPTV